MIYRFDAFELDLAKFELRAGGRVRPVEPQVFALLALLVGNRERLVSRDEMIEKVWDGRIVSDAAIASRIKSARQALGDDGASQRFIRTVHRQGFRFVAEAKMVGAAAVPGAATAQLSGAADRPSLAVLPFRLLGDAGPCAPIAEALPHELIAALARLRWLFVTARGSSFRLRANKVDAADVASLLGVRYYLCGTVEVVGARLGVSVELVDTRGGGIVWAEHLSGGVGDVHRVREEICARILSALEIHIPMHEAAQARLAVSGHLDAWSAYHLGLHHMYRFNRADNALAAVMFRQALALDPQFARAHAALSFVHFQSAFLHYSDDLAGEMALSRRSALRGMELDPIDPFINYAMGRSFWLEGDLHSSLLWLERATSISPNYAQGLYALAWTETLAGRVAEGRSHVDLAMRLSPLDPLYYGMLGTRALNHLMDGDDAAAAEWAERAARSPGAHALIAMVAVAAHALAGDAARAASWSADVRARNPALTRADFFRAFPMHSTVLRERIAGALDRFGL